MLKKLVSGIAIALVACATVYAADVELEGVTCVVADKPASEGKSADYKGGKVYFCCGGCAGKFAKGEKKFAASANRQLVATKQFKQTACPISGRDVDDAQTSTVSGVKVAFCCGGCKGKVDKADDKGAVKLVFADKAFKKAFKKAESK